MNTIGPTNSNAVLFAAQQKKKSGVLETGVALAALATASLGLPTAANAHGDHHTPGPQHHVHVEAGGMDIPVYAWPLGLAGLGAAGVALAMRNRKKSAEKTEKSE